MTTAYPLSWPEGWPRTTNRKAGHQFVNTSWDGPKREVTFDRARTLLMKELERLGARGVVLSTNLPLRLDGQPYADAARRQMPDPGVAVYFTYKGRQMVMAQDAFQYIAANMRSLGLAIEAMRSLERHGGGTMMERAFTGFAALPAPKGHWERLGIKPTKDARLITDAFRLEAKKAHPDAGGSEAAMQDLNAARDAAMRELENRL